MFGSWRSASPGLLLGWCLVAASVTTLAVAPYASTLAQAQCAFLSAPSCDDATLPDTARAFATLSLAGALVLGARAWWRKDGWVSLCFGARVRAWSRALFGLALAVAALWGAYLSASEVASLCVGASCASHTSPLGVVRALGGIVAAFAGALLAAQGVTALAGPRRARPPLRRVPSGPGASRPRVVALSAQAAIRRGR